MRNGLFVLSFLVAGPVAAATDSAPVCMIPDPSVLAAGNTLLLDPGRENVPTNAFLFRSELEQEVLGWRALVRLESDETGDFLESEGGEGFFGRMDLLPESAYAVDLWNLDDDDAREPRETVLFSTGAGPDDQPPEPPEIVDEYVSDVVPEGSYEAECGGTIPGRDAATDIEWQFSGERGTTAWLFDLGVSSEEPVDMGEIFHKGEARGHVAFRTGEPGIREMGLVLEDLAGNRSEALVFEADFAGCGMCTQSSMIPASGVLLVLRVARRRRTTRPASTVSSV